MSATAGGKTAAKPSKSLGKNLASPSKLMASSKAITSSMVRMNTQSSLMGQPGDEYHDQAQTVQKPDDQLDLTDKQLNEEMTRVLKAMNPHAPSNSKRFSFKEGAYKQVGQVDQLAMHWEMQSNIIHRESDDAVRQLERDEKLRGAAGGRSTATMSSKDLMTSSSKLKSSSSKLTTSTSSARAGQDGEQVGDDAPAAAAEGAGAGESGAPPAKLQNQFNFSERASMTFNNPARDRGTMTVPPPRCNYSGSVTQWEIYDAYRDELDRQQREKDAKEKKKGGRDDTGGGGRRGGGGDDDLAVTVGSQGGGSEDCGPVARVAKIMERMINQNTFDGVAQDFRYYQDPLDETRRPNGTLMPLWRFAYDGAKRMTVTAIANNPRYADLFAVGYGSFSFDKPAKLGLVCFHTLKNPSFPEYVFRLGSGVMSLDVHPQLCHLVAVGMYDGSVAVLDVRRPAAEQPSFQCAVRDKHTDPVWQVRWQKEDSEARLNFFSVSSDGQVACWTILKIHLERKEVVTVRLLDGDATQAARGAGGGNAAPTTQPDLARATCFDFSPVVDNVYLVGTEEGIVHKCSKTYSTKFLASVRAHSNAVYAVRWNPLQPRVFATCSADWSLKLWDEQDLAAPLFKFDFGDAVTDFDWSPFASTVFICSTEDGTLRVYDLSVDKYDPLCQQLVTQKKNMHLTRLIFNREFPIVLAGDDRGYVTSLKLSPNLRLAVEQKTYSQESEAAKMDKLIAWVQEPADHK